MAVEHYENFPVAGVLCPPRLRPAVEAVYAYARTADDLADEGDASASERLAALTAYRADLHAVLRGEPPSQRWHGTFERLAAARHQFDLPGQLLDDLLSAFLQDIEPPVYATRTELLDYCSRSANPVGRLMLHLDAKLYGRSVGPQCLAWSDAICSALQLINFWQDLGLDVRRGRHYVPRADGARHGVSHVALAAGVDTAATRALVADLVGWSRRLMLDGAPLVHALRGRTGWELRLVVQGGLRILERIEATGFAALQHRPVIGKRDAPLLLWRALRMRRKPLHMAAAQA